MAKIESSLEKIGIDLRYLHKAMDRRCDAMEARFERKLEALEARFAQRLERQR